METQSSEFGGERSAGNRERSTGGNRAIGLAKVSSAGVCSALNRLIVSNWSETLALEAAGRIVDGSESRKRLHEQVERRRIFRRDLVMAVTSLQGVPVTHAARGAMLAAGARRVRELIIGPHQGDAYAVCARATERAATAYSKALALELPADVLFGIERQSDEVEWDRRELRRLRWGASPARSPEPTFHEQTAPTETTARN